MKQIQPYLAVACALLLSAPRGFGQDSAQGQQFAQRIDPPTAPLGTQNPRWYSGFVEPYRWRPVSPINLSNSSRLDSLMRGGNLYLSLEDAIALALENNIDVEVQRYGFLIADQNLKLAQSGGGAGNVNTAVTGASLSAGAPGAGAGLTNA